MNSPINDDHGDNEVDQAAYDAAVDQWCIGKQSALKGLFSKKWVTVYERWYYMVNDTP